MRELKEQDIQRGIIEYLLLKKYVIFKHHSTGTTVRNGETVYLRYGDRGISDLIGCSPTGQFIAIEVKKPGGRPTPEQLEFISRVNANGGKGFVAFSLDDVIEALANPS
jgi:hypothetical protein